MKKIVLSFLVCFLLLAKINAQTYFSIATDLSILRSFSPKQRFFALGQTVQGNWHFTSKESAYAWISYYTNGKFRNNMTAKGIDSTANPQQFNYTLFSNLRFRQISVGWKHYFKGSFNSDNSINIYGTAGFGLLLARATNTYSQYVDTSKYATTVYTTPGVGKFRRLTFDLGLGTEIPVGADIYLYTELRTWLQASDYPSPFLVNNNAPRILAINGGIRILLE